MSEQLNTNPSMFQGWLPLRRVIALGITSAAVFAAVAGAYAGSSDSAPAYTVIDRNDRIIDIRDGDGQLWTCVGEVGEDTCAMDAQRPGGVVEPLGYRTAAAAAENCPNGTVTANWRRNQVVGYGCEIDWRKSLQGQ